MSSKFDNMSRGDTALALVWEQQRTDSRPDAVVNPAEEAQNKLPFPLIDPPQEILEDGYNYYSISRSMHMMAGMFEGIINLRYAKKYGEIRVQGIESDGLVFAMGFYPQDVSAEEGEEFDIYEDPDFFDAVRAFLSDLDQFTVGTSVDITLNECGLVGHSKLDMYRVLSEYLCSEEYAMGTPDSVFISDNTLDSVPFVHGDRTFDDKDLMAHYMAAQRTERQLGHAQTAAALFKDLPRFRELGRSPDPLFTVNNTPVHSMKEFYQSCFISGNADLPMSLGHLYQMICQEEGLNPRDYHHIVMGNKITMGGYN